MRTRGAAAREESLRALYDAHARRLLAYALRLTDGDRPGPRTSCRRRCCAPGGTSTGSTRAPARSGRGCSPSPSTWPIDAHRARRARPPEVGDAALATVPGLDQIEGTLDRIIVTDALQSLSPEHRAVIVETYYRGRSVAEAAAVLGIPPGTVKSRCYYALRALKLALAERGVTT